MRGECLMDTKNLIFIGGIIPESQYDDIISKSMGPIQYAADALQKSFIEGLAAIYDNILVINLPFIGSWPKRYKSIYSPTQFNRHVKLQNGSYQLNNLRFLNITGFKLLSRYRVLKRNLDNYCKQRNDEQIVFIIYSIHTPFLKAAVDIKSRYKNVRVILIAPDLPEYMDENRGGPINVVCQRNIEIQNGLYNKVDGFVLLSEYMKDRLIANNQPYCVVEGIFNQSSESSTPSVRPKDKKIIFYSGTLARRYCIMNLVEAVQRLDRQDFRLDIYGDGDCRDEIIKISKVDNRIKYCGQKPRNEILKKQQEVFLLVNPRTSEGEFTKYSFPSKTMEYLASGTPTLIYRLPGIPDEYYEHCFALEDSSIETLSHKINEILDLSGQELSRMGNEARQFILDNKNPVKQVGKLNSILEKLN